MLSTITQEPDFTVVKTQTHITTISSDKAVNIAIHQGNSAIREEIGSKIRKAMRRRKSRPYVETASEGLRAIREGC